MAVKSRPVYNNFNAGEISPLMLGRVDFTRFQNGAETLQNWILHVQGGVSRRWGTKYVRDCKDMTRATRIIPFEFSDEAYYLIELAHQDIRVHRIAQGDTVSITVPGGLTLWSDSELLEVQYAQSGDIVYFTHQSHPIIKLARLASDGSSWDIKQATFLPPPSYEKEVWPNCTLAPAAISGSTVRFYAGDDYFLAADKDKLIQYLDSRAIIKTVDASLIFIDAEIFDNWPSSSIVAGLGNASGAATTITTSVNHGLTEANVGDVIVITSGAKSGEVRRIDGVPAVNQLTINAAFSGDPGGATWDRGVHMDAKAWKLIGSPAAKLTADKIGPVGGIVTLTLDIAGMRAVDATKSWDETDVGKYVKAMGGLVRITGRSSTTSVTGQIMSTLKSAPTSAPYETLAGTWTLESEAWSASAGYPASVCFYEQRLWFGGTTSRPQTIWGSVTNDYENFAAGAAASDSVEYTIASNEINHIRWLASGRVLMIGTGSREFRASGGTEAITPSNIDIRPETSYGSPKRRPVQIGHTLIFLQRAKRRLRELAYYFESDNYKAADLTNIAPHISDGGIEDLAYCPEPHSILYCIRGDGQLLALTYEKQEDVFGWGRIITDGYFESIAILPPMSGSDEYQVYTVVKRTINGSTKRYVEKFDSALHTDCAKTGTGPITTVTGLSYLEGKTVRMKGDGALYSDAVVTSGQVAFSESVDAYEVGLPYSSTLVTHRPELATKEGSVQGLPKRWANLIIRVIDTIGLKVNGTQIATREPEDLLGQVPAAETGDIAADVLGIDGDGKITISQDLPFPATVVMIAGDLVVGG